MRTKTLLLAGLAASVIGLAPAMAQQPGQPSPGAPGTPGQGTAPRGTMPPEPSQRPGQTGQDQRPDLGRLGAFLQSQGSGQMLVSRLMDRNIYSVDGATIGEIEDLLIDRNGNVVAVLVGVGGFLGIGQKDVAIPFRQIELVAGAAGGDERMTVRLSRSDLDAAPEFRGERRSRSGGTSGSGTGSGIGTTR